MLVQDGLGALTKDGVSQFGGKAEIKHHLQLAGYDIGRASTAIDIGDLEGRGGEKVISLIPLLCGQFCQCGGREMDGVLGQVGIGHMALHAAYRHSRSQRATAAVLDHIAHAGRGRGLSHHTPIDFLVARFQPFDHFHRAVFGGAFLVAGNQEGDAAIVVGVTLALMEALNDFGTVEFFAVPTFTAGIYDVWLNMNSVAGAAQMASVMMVLVLALIGTERFARRGQRYHHTSSKYSTLPSHRLESWTAAFAFVACLLPVLLGFALPAGVLTAYALEFYSDTLSAKFFTYAANSLSLSAIAAGLAVLIGLFLAYGSRLGGGPVVKAATRFASIGYAVPGAILAIGVMIPLARLDNALDGLSQQVLGIPTGLLLSGTIVAVVYGYVARFLALSYGTLEASLDKITPSMDGAARTLGCTPGQALRRVHFPLVRGSLLTAALLVFVDCMKELPLTIILRPFNYETLATFVFQYASDELLEESALGALTIVAAGILPVILLSLTIVRSRPGHPAGGMAADTGPEVAVP